MVDVTIVLTRRPRVPRAQQFRRAVLLGFAIGLLGVAWRVVQPWVTYLVGVASVGAPRHPALLYEAFRARYTDFPPADEFAWSKTGLEILSARSIWSGYEPRPGLVSVVGPWQELRICDYYDRWLNWVGRHTTEIRPGSPTDADGDGRLEVIDSFDYSEVKPGRDISGWIVVRLGGSGTNQVAGVMAVDWRAFATWHKRTGVRVLLRLVWRDEDGDGRQELVFVTVITYKDPRWGLAFLPPETVAVLEWNHAGGVLVPRVVPPDCGIEVWVERDPVGCDPDESLQ